ncbi:MAG TPA: hypothetical protein VKE30_01510 [Chthoniobacterales bacterium]|nr:hypothetical protein [Chthoniobacterales bacterium]
MNDFSELENQLRKLRPVQPSPDLVMRIEGALAEPESPILTAGMLARERRFHFNWLSLGVGLAAATALVMLVFLRLQQPAKKNAVVAGRTPAPAISTNPNAEFVPAALTQVVYHTRDEGLRFPGNSNQPMRRVRSQTRETLQWRNPKTGASLRISYPSEEVSLVPATGQ